MLLALALLTLAPQDTSHLVVVATADVHGRVMAWDYVADRPVPYGLTRAASVIDSLRRRYSGRVIVLDAGDALQGSALSAYYGTEELAENHPVIDAMNAMGYDAAAVGDHDFDFGVTVMRNAFAPAEFPHIAANLVDTVGAPVFAPSV